MSTVALIEPAPVITEFCSGLAHIEAMGSGCLCLVFYADQVLYETGGQPVRVVQKRIVMPLDAVKPIMDMLLQFLAKRQTGGIGPPK